MTEEQTRDACYAQIRALVEELLSTGMFSHEVTAQVTKCLEESIKTYYDSLGTRHA